MPSLPVRLRARSATAAGSAGRWFKGNTHTHTLNSDGDSTPDEVVRWYRDHSYHFLVLTDHNFLTDVDGAQRAARRRREVPCHQGRGSVVAVREQAAAHQRPGSRSARRGSREGTQRRRGAAEATSTPSAWPTACRTSTIRTSAGRSPPTTWRACATTSCSRSTTAIRWSTTSAAAGTRVSSRHGTRCCPAASSSSASRPTMRTSSRSSTTSTSSRPGRDG